MHAAMLEVKKRNGWRIRIPRHSVDAAVKKDGIGMVRDASELFVE